MSLLKLKVGDVETLVKYEPLPDIYKKIKGVSFRGGSQVNTGYVFGTSDTIEATMYYTFNDSSSTGGSFNMLFGARSSNGNIDNYTMFGRYTGGNAIVLEGSRFTQTIMNRPNYIFKITSSKTNVKIVNLSTGETMANVSFNNPWTGCTTNLFINATSDNHMQTANLDLYSFVIRTGDTIKVRLVPVKRKSDNKIGLYDMVRNMFITEYGSYPAMTEIV